MNPGPNSKSSWKLPKLREIVQDMKPHHTVPFIAICETWLKPHISDAELNINNYEIFRADRQKSLHGGVIVYTHQKLAIDDYLIYDDNICESVICKSTNHKCIICCLYRPPNADQSSFVNLFKFINSYVAKHNTSNEMQLIVFGDFNLPKFSWDEGKELDTSIPEYVAFQKFTENNLLCQYVKEKTRKSNILDLFLVDNPNFVLGIECKDIYISDHKVVKVHTDYFHFHDSDNNCKNSDGYINDDFAILNFETADWKNIELELMVIDWVNLINETKVENFPIVFHNIIFSIMQSNCLKFSTGRRRKRQGRFKRKRATLSRKIRKLNKQLSEWKLKNYGRSRIQTLEAKIQNLHEAQKQSFFDERSFVEDQAVSKIKVDSSYFFKYAKKLRNVLPSPSILVDPTSNKVMTDPKEIVDSLQNQFQSVFSLPSPHCSSNTNFSIPKIKQPLPDLVFTTYDIIRAINEMKHSSASPNNGIPACIFKNCKKALALPLKLFWEKSFNAGIVPSDYKLQQIVPIYKKGTKTDPANYRPVSLTSHVIKIFERVLRLKLVDYLEFNNIIQSNQHGFRKKP